MSRIPACVRLGRSILGHSSVYSKGLSYRLAPSQVHVNFLFSKTENKVQNENKQSSSNEGGETVADGGENTKINEEIESLKKQVENLNEKSNELMDKYKRALADGENARQRFNKQLEESKLYGIQSFCKDLLDIADTLSLATESVPKEEVKESNPHLKSLYEGLMMTDSNMKSVFKRHGLEYINPLGEKFDPNFHEALFEQEVEGKEANTVVVVSKIGYKLHNRVIRPALVGISKS